MGLVTIASENLSADIDGFGAELAALRDASGLDLQWNGDPAVWKGRAPILFPIVGGLSGNQYRLDDAHYAMARHGFARLSPFALVEATASSATFQLAWNAETFRQYPFRFELDMHFALTGARLDLQASVKNLETDKPLPASFGFHPALRWPLPYGAPRSAHEIVFEKDEAAPIRRLDADGLLKPEAFETPVVQKHLLLRDALFQDDAIIFDRIASSRLRYGAPSGPQIEIHFPDTPYLGLWSKPGAGFVCIEPCHGHADPQGFSGDFRTKPGIFLVAPGQAKECRMSISLCA